jgi:uncharacterized integral membrane protein (TIGR00697 family)
MMINELILLGNILFLSFMAVVSLRLGKEALVSFTVITILLANLFVLKQTTLFTLQATSADALAVGSMLGFNLLQEFYSRLLAQRTIIITFIMLAMYIVLAKFQLLYIPSALDQTHHHFHSLLAVMPLLVGGSMVSWALAQCIDFIIFGVLQRIWLTRFLIIRNYIAIGCSQAIDTLLYTQLLYWLSIIENPVHIFIISFSIKFAITLIATPLIALMAWRHDEV